MKNHKSILLSIITPVHNEQDSIDIFMDAIESTIDELDRDINVELIFVDDGSSDSTIRAIKSRMSGTLQVRLIVLTRNFGKEAALTAGLAYSLGDIAIPIDVDLQDPTYLIKEMIQKWRNGAMVVNARRIDRSGDSLAKRVSSSLYYKVFNALAENPIPADVGDFRLIDRQVINFINSLTEKSRFNKGLFNWAGFRMEEVTFEREIRSNGVSKWSYWKLWKFGLDGILASSTVPLRIWVYLGSMLALISFLYAAYEFIKTLFFGIESPGYSSTIILILTFGGLNMLSVGILGEYIGRIYREVQNRPLYVVQTTIEVNDKI